MSAHVFIITNKKQNNEDILCIIFIQTFIQSTHDTQSQRLPTSHITINNLECSNPDLYNRRVWIPTVSLTLSLFSHSLFYLTDTHQKQFSFYSFHQTNSLNNVHTRCEKPKVNIGEYRIKYQFRRYSKPRYIFVTMVTVMLTYRNADLVEQYGAGLSTVSHTWK